MQHPVRDKLRVMCHQLKMNALSSVRDERTRNDLACRIKLLPNPESILSMTDSDLTELRVRAEKLMLDIEGSDNARTHDGYVSDMTNKRLPPSRKPILPTRNWYALAKIEESRVCKTAKRGDYSWVFVNLPDAAKKEMHSFGESIDKSDIYTSDDDKYGIEDEPHITVKYALVSDDVEEVRKKLDGEAGGKMHLGKSSIFESDDYDVVKISVTSADLKRLHDKIGELENEDKYPTYQAHATIAYVKKGSGKKYVGKFVLDKDVDFDHVFFEDTKNNTTKIGLE